MQKMNHSVSRDPNREHMMNEQMSRFVTRQVEARSTEFGVRIRTTAQTLHTIADQFRADTNTHAAAGMTDRGADVLDQIGVYLANSDFDALVADVEDFSRQRPWTIGAIGLATGILAARLLKAAAAGRNAAGVEGTQLRESLAPNLASSSIGDAATPGGRGSKLGKKASSSGIK